MKPKTVWIAAAALAIALVAAWFAIREMRREAFITRCNEEGAGGMFTSREYCEALYERGVVLPPPPGDAAPAR
jgi:hypothetical protein